MSDHAVLKQKEMGTYGQMCCENLKLSGIEGDHLCGLALYKELKYRL